MRPASIITFERLFLASAVLGLVNTALLAPRLTPARSPLSGSAMTAVIVIGAAIGIGLMLLLWWFVARRASVVAKWLTVAVAAYTLFSMAYGAIQGTLIGGLLGVSVVVAGVLQIVAVLFLFRADARDWFARSPEYVA